MKFFVFTTFMILEVFCAGYDHVLLVLLISTTTSPVPNNCNTFTLPWKILAHFEFTGSKTSHKR